MDTDELQWRFGKVVLRRRLAAELSQEDLAAKVGIHRNHLSLLERGKHTPNLAVAHKIAIALGVKLTTLIAEVEDEKTPLDEPPALPKGRPRKDQKTEREPKKKKAR